MKARIFFCFITTLIVFLFFAHTLNYPWKYFDDQIIYNETVFPIAGSLSELLEYIKHFGLNHFFEASNPYYSSVSNLRGTPLGTLFILIILFLFKKSYFNYHLFALALHLINTAFCFFILHKTIHSCYNKGSKLFILLFTSILTLIWSLHPVNVESVLLATNFGALVTYLFCFFFLFWYTTLYKGRVYELVLFFLLYLLTIFFNEYAVTFPFIIFSYLLAFNTLQNSKIPLASTFPFFLALALYTICFFFFSPITRTLFEGSSSATLERIFFLSPLVFFHLLKLFFLPIKLTIDQSAELQPPLSLFDPYAVFCFLFMYSLILISFVSLFFLKKKPFFLVFILFVPFFFALLPFLHIISPIYNLASERYLYLPSFFFILGVSHLLGPAQATRQRVIVILIFILIVLSSRTLARTFDWKDSVSLFSSSLNTTSNSLIKALRISMLAQIYLKEGKKEWIRYHELLNKISYEHLFTLEEEKLKKIPEVVKAYGLDPKTLQVKTAYLIASKNLGISMDINKAYNFFAPFVREFTPLDTQILDFYLALLFATKNLDKLEEVLNSTLEKKLSPTTLVIMGELIKTKYKDFNKAKMYLQKSLEYFPYDAQTLSALAKLYLETSNDKEFAYFSYLYRLRMHLTSNSEFRDES